eukprot:366028-Chlamydomonas_euryale.AAC.36
MYWYIQHGGLALALRGSIREKLEAFGAEHRKIKYKIDHHENSKVATSKHARRTVTPGILVADSVLGSAMVRRSLGTQVTADMAV